MLASCRLKQPLIYNFGASLTDGNPQSILTAIVFTYYRHNTKYPTSRLPLLKMADEFTNKQTFPPEIFLMIIEEYIEPYSVCSSYLLSLKNLHLFDGRYGKLMLINKWFRTQAQKIACKKFSGTFIMHTPRESLEEKVQHVLSVQNLFQTPNLAWLLPQIRYLLIGELSPCLIDMVDFTPMTSLSNFELGYRLRSRSPDKTQDKILSGEYDEWAINLARWFRNC